MKTFNKSSDIPNINSYTRINGNYVSETSKSILFKGSVAKYYFPKKYIVKVIGNHYDYYFIKSFAVNYGKVSA